MEEQDIQYLIGRLYRAKGFIEAGHHHMAIACILADISALQGFLPDDEKPLDPESQEA